METMNSMTLAENFVSSPAQLYRKAESFFGTETSKG
jgi:hypothetical protein